MGVSNLQSSWVVRVLCAVATCVTWPATSFGQVNVIISDDFSAVYREVLPEFE